MDEQEDRVLYEYIRNGRTLTTPSYNFANNRADAGSDIVRTNLDYEEED